MEITLTLIYKCVQAAAVVLLAGWIICGRMKGFGSFCRGAALFLAIAAPILLYLSRQEKVHLLIWIYLGISVFVFLVYAVDKILAVSRRSRTRVPENVLVLLSLFGVLGGISGMLVFHHKNKKAKLQYAVPVIALLELGALYFFRLKDLSFQMFDWKSLSVFEYMTAATTAVLCVILVKTFILVRLLVIIPVSVSAALLAVRLFYRMENSVTLQEMIKAKPIPVFAVAAVVFLILELISVKSRYITSGNEVKKKTDHSSPEK